MEVAARPQKEEQREPDGKAILREVTGQVPRGDGLLRERGY